MSITFDDAWTSQVDLALPLLDGCGISATFYVDPRRAEQRLSEWRGAAASGHEIGNHSMTHPCSGNFEWSASNALENYTLDDIERDIDEATKEIDRLFGVSPESFAYPCGQTFVGRGQSAVSYIPAVARRFVVGRGWLGESHNNPHVCDLAHASGIKMDGEPAANLIRQIEAAVERRSWVILVGHEVASTAQDSGLAVDSHELSLFLDYIRDRSETVWTETVSRVGAYLQSTREQRPIQRMG